MEIVVQTFIFLFRLRIFVQRSKWSSYAAVNNLTIVYSINDKKKLNSNDTHAPPPSCSTKFFDLRNIFL